MGPLLNAVAYRMPAFGTTASQTGAFVEPVTNVVLFTESSIEAKLLRALFADPKVREVRYQALQVMFHDADGVLHHHTVDLVATLHDGTRIGYVVKAEGAAIKLGTRDEVEAMSASVSSKDVDRLQLVTSGQLPEWSDQNAYQLISARRGRRTYIDDELRDLAPQLTSPIKIGELSERLGGGDIAYRPILRAIFFGTLTYLSVGVINEDSKVLFSGKVMPDTDLATVPPRATGEEPPTLNRYKKPRKKRRSVTKASA